MDKRKLALIIAISFIMMILALGLMTALGVISKMTWIGLFLNVFGKDVDVEDVGSDVVYLDFQGLHIPSDAWDTAYGDDELIIENKTATIGIKTIEKEVDDMDDYLSSKASELSLDLSSNGMDTYVERYKMCDEDAYIVIAESESTNYLIIFWYMEERIYTINALYDIRADADEVIASITCS
ncbi:MAG TPA: hypothetical protein PK718_04650 [Candidatus Methanofastidiosa archaeon]|nr:hypothetical protein [Candidatus Methanofastidiosa archaeon]